MGDQIVSLYESGLSLREVADKVGVSLDTVRWRLRVAGVKLRPVGRPAIGGEKICITISPAAVGRLDKAATKSGKSRSEFIEGLLARI